MTIDIDKAARLDASFHGMTRLPLGRQLALLLGLAISIALGLSVVMWTGGTDYSVLYLQNPAPDPDGILKVLRQRKIAFKRDAHSGMIMVESGKVAEARMALAARMPPQFDGDGSELPAIRQDFAANNFIRNTRYQHALEAELARNVESILSSVVGTGKVRALVVAIMDFTHGAAGRRSHPAAMATHKHERQGTSIKGKGMEQSPHFSEIDDRARMAGSHPQVVGVIRRLSVAVVVDHKKVRNNKGEVVSTTYTRDELQRFTRLAKEAVGFDAKRGDTIDVINAEFAASPGFEAAATTSVLDEPWVREAGRQIPVVLTVVLILFGVLRPVMLNLASIPHPKGAAGGVAVPNKDQFSLTGEQDRNTRASRDYESNLAMAKSLVIQEPKRVAKVVKQWINED